MSENKPAAAAAGVVVRTAPEVVGTRPRSVPHYGLLIQGAVMAGLGFPLLALALLTPAHIVFVWIGMGIALGGGGCCSLAFAADARLPAGTRANYGMLILSAFMGLIGLAILLSIPIAGNGFASIHPSNVFVWVGGGLLLGGGGCCWLTWESERPDVSDRLKKPPKPMQ